MERFFSSRVGSTCLFLLGLHLKRASDRRAPESTIRFPGQYYDAETGLHYNRFRYYDPSIGRYISADPIGQNGGSNLYRYAVNNPISNIDPNGDVSVSFELFAGGGGRVSFGRDNASGNFFGSVGIGIGFGVGFSFDPEGAPPGADVNCGGENGEVQGGLSVRADGSAGVGGLSAGFTKEAGFAVNESGSVDTFNEQSESLPGGSFGLDSPTETKFKVSASLTINANIGKSRTSQQSRFARESR